MSEGALLQQLKAEADKKGCSIPELLQHLGVEMSEQKGPTGENNVSNQAEFLSKVLSGFEKILDRSSMHDELLQTSMSGLSKKDLDFNSMVNQKAAEIPDSAVSAFDKWLDKNLDLRKQSVHIGDSPKPIARPQGDDVFQILCYTFVQVMTNSTLNEDHKKLWKRIVAQIQKGSFKQLSLSQSQNFLLTKSLGFLITISRTLKSLLEPLYIALFEDYENELTVIQKSVKLLDTTIDMLEKVHSKKEWDAFDFQAKVQMIVDSELNYPLTTGGSFKKVIKPVAKMGDMQKVVRRQLFASKPQANTSSQSRKRRFDNSSENTRKKFKQDFSAAEIQKLKNKTASAPLKSRVSRWLTENSISQKQERV